MIRMTRTSKNGQVVETQDFPTTEKARAELYVTDGISAGAWTRGRDGELFHCIGGERYELTEIAEVAPAEAVEDAARALAADARPFAIRDRVAHVVGGATGTVVGLGTGRPDGILDVRWDKPKYGEIEVSGDWRRNFRHV
ncbi:hypothetical protein [Micromonospora sp. NPDC047730]|uniref:hypothetical protein n=1 Tax=Micromonospora sp. NPDC047730 TaxID=3364253 RepID=UPI00371F1139